MVNLRQYKSSDLDQHAKLLVQNKVYKSVKVAKEKEVSWLKKSISNYKSKKPPYYVLAITFNKKLIGNIILEKIGSKNPNVGFWIAKKYWGKGYATKALKIFLRKVKRKFKPKIIKAQHKTNNPASGRVLEKCGFELTSKDKNKSIYKLK